MRLQPDITLNGRTGEGILQKVADAIDKPSVVTGPTITDEADVAAADGILMQHMIRQLICCGQGGRWHEGVVGGGQQEGRHLD